jgi:hypothetical protein
MPETAELSLGRPHADTLAAIRTRLHLERDEAAFVARASKVPERPPNDLVILEMNRHGDAVDREAAAHLEEGPNRCAVKST